MVFYSFIESICVLLLTQAYGCALFLRHYGVILLKYALEAERKVQKSFSDRMPMLLPIFFKTCASRSASSFTDWVINTWNSLANYVVSANTTNMFKNRLDNFWQSQDIVYAFIARIHGTGSLGML